MKVEQNMINFGKRLRELRSHLDISQKEFAKRCGVTASFISELEKGKTKPSFDLLIKFCGLFDVSPNWLILGKGKMFLEDEYEHTESIEGDRDLKKLIRSLGESPLLKHTVLSFVYRFYLENEELIKKDISAEEEISSKAPHTEN